MRRWAGALLLVAAVVPASAVAACGPGGERVLVAAGTTLVDSGLLDAVVAEYERTHPGVELSVVGEATAQVLELARRGGADLAITHAPQAEQAFIDEGRAAVVEPVLVSRFLLVGPPDRVGDLSGLGVADAFARIASEQWTFVTRNDGSGTHAREQEIWSLAGVVPDDEPWYVATGQGMGLTLQVADQRDAFVLAEEGTYLAARPVLSLVPVALAPEPELLANPYRALVVAGSDGEAAAADFVAWLRSNAGRAAVLAANDELFGRVVYGPAE